MAMNRQTKRMLQRQGQLAADGAPPGRRPPSPPRPPSGSGGGRRSSPGEFFKDVRGELRRVNWPTREEVISYSTIVLFTLVLLVGLIFVLDFLFAKSVLFLFET